MQKYYYPSVFWIIHAIKNIPKIKVLQMPCKFSIIFMEYLRILGTENIAGGQAPGHEGPGRTHSD